MKKVFVLGSLAAAGFLAVALTTISTQRLPQKPPPRAGMPPSTTSVAVPNHAELAETDSAREEARLQNWAATFALANLAATIEHTNSIEDPVFRSKVRAALLNSWAERDLPGALRWFAQRGGADPLQEQARDLFARTMADRDPTAMFSWMRTVLPSSAQAELYGPFFRQWAKKSPAAAAAQLQLMADTSDPGSAAQWTDLLGPAAAQWAHANLGQALEWVKALPAGPGKTSALRQMSDAWATADPHRAADYAMQQKDTDLLERIAGKWAENDPRSAASWAAALPAGPAQDAAVARVATIWAEDDPAAAAAYTASLPPRGTQSDAALGVVSMWAQTAPDETAQWVARFPEGPTRDQAVSALTRTWALASVSDASQWIQSLPGGHSRDMAVTAFTSAAAVSSPATAFQLALTMSDPDLRSQQVTAAARAWLQKDPAGAQEAIAQSNLPPELKNSLGSPALNP